MDTYAKKTYWTMISVYSLTHFLVDFACAFLMFRSISGTADGYICLLIYNFCAFGMQMPLGIIADKWNRNFLFAIIGCILVSVAYGLIFVPVAAVFVVGMGNAMFHIGGGVDILNISEKRLGALGVFVSPGAFGIYYGTILGKGSGFSPIIISIALIIASVIILAVYKLQKSYYPKNSLFSLEGIESKYILMSVFCLFIVVCLRSYVGLSLNFTWKGIGTWGTALICAVVFGKTLGGFIADRFGIIKTTVFSLAIATILFLFPQIPIAGVAAVLLFNMTMPITLWAMAKILPNAKGFAFGLLTFGLFIGFLPTYLGITVSGEKFWIFPIIAVISLVILLLGLRRAKL